MSAMDADLGRIFRRYVSGLERDGGSAVPETIGNQATPIHDTAQDQVTGTLVHGRSDSYADRDDTGPAFRNAPNSMGWRDQDRCAFTGYRERIVFAPADTDGKVITLDPNRAASWWVDCAGSVTFQLADPEPVQGVDPSSDIALQAELLTVFVVRNKDKSITWPSDWKWSVEVRGGAIGSDNPFAGASADAQIDAFTIYRVPNRGVFAFVSGRKFA